VHDLASASALPSSGHGKGQTGVRRCHPYSEARFTRVLMVNTPRSKGFGGGDSVQMNKTAQAMASMGMHVEFSFDAQPRAKGFDLAHVFNMRTIHITLRQIRSLKKSGIPVVMSPIYLNPSRRILGNAEHHADFRLPALVG